MNPQFLDHLQIVVNIHLRRNSQTNDYHNYQWFCNTRKPSSYPLPIIDEFLIRQALKKVTPEQQVIIIKQLLNWLDYRPEVPVSAIPGIALQFLHQRAECGIIEQANFSRTSSLRNSLRSFRNKITPAGLQKRRSVNFNDVPVVYCIKY